VHTMLLLSSLPQALFYVLISYPYHAGYRMWSMVKPPHPSSLSRSLISCDRHMFFMLLVNVTPHLLSRRPRGILRNAMGFMNKLEYYWILFDTIYKPRRDIHINILHLILHWRARTAEAFPHTFCSSFILSCILHYSVTFNPIPWIIPKKSLVQLLMLIFRFWNNSHRYFVWFYATVF